jgi:predicted ATP-grasp superfamily ATP-dependent carboligase
MAEPLLIIGASTRAAAFSALRAGLQPWCVDLFADLDLQRHCAVTRLTERYPAGFRRFIESELPGPWMYTGALENWPRLVARFSRHRPLWGNGRLPLPLARSPEHVFGFLQARRMPVPALYRGKEPFDATKRWLIKPCRGAAGIGVRFCREGESPPKKASTYCQEFIDGQPVSLLFLGDIRQSRLLGMTRQLIGEPWLHAAPFRYCGSIGPLDPSIVQRPSLEELGDVLAWECYLEGLFGVDGVLRDGTFWPVEINPRYTASVEVLEHATGLRAIAEHAHVFLHGAWGADAISLANAGPYVGKAILFARDDLIFPADGPWMAELCSPTPVQKLPAFADIPAAGQQIEASRPILTFFARGATLSACEDALRQIAADLDRLLFGR